MATQHRNVPVLRFSEFHGKWINKNIKSIAPLQRGFDLPTTRIKSGKYPVVYSNGILRTHNEFKVTGPCVVTGRSGTIGQVTFINKNFWPHNTSLWVTDFCGNDPKFIYYFFIQIRLKKYNAGSTIPTLNRNDVHSIKASIPESLEEQQNIASFLSSVDTKIEQLGKKKALLKQYKKGIMQKLFSQEIRFKDEQGMDYPDWKETRLGLAFSERVERGHVDGEMLSVTLSSGVVRARDLNRHDNSPGDKSRYKRVNVNDIAYNSMRMWQGASGVSKFEGIVSPAYTVLTPNQNQHSDFWGFYFKIQNVIQTFQRNSQGLTSDTWNLKYSPLSKIKLFVPNKQEQQKIANFLSAIDKKIELVAEQLEQARSFKKGLLQQMFI